MQETGTMAQQTRGASLRHIRTLFSLGTVGGLADGQLLECYRTRADEAAQRAFTILVERHGPMVFRVCREILHDEHAAHDAFQATFLVLVRRARSLWTRDSLGPWLYQVAVRVAWNARSAAARRRRHEHKAATLTARSAPGERGDDVGPVLHEELCRLAERDRAVIVLCCLEGLTQEQAARQLGWPLGTVQSRLARGRERLRGRLMRRGLTPGVIVAALTTATSEASVAGLPALSDAAIDGLMSLAAAHTSAAPAGLVPASVAALTEGVLTAMFLSKLKIAALCLLSAGLLVTGVGILAGQETATAPAGIQPAGTTRPGQTAGPDRPAGAAPNAEDPTDALKQRLVEMARRRLEAQEVFYKQGRITIDRYLDASDELRLAEIDASTKREARIAAARAHLERANEVEANERREHQEGRGTTADVTEAEQRRLKAELGLRLVENPAGSDELMVLQDRLGAVERKLDRVVQALEELKRARDR
jgi:RNA polymerase sigma factor (sigma-70 family)